MENQLAKNSVRTYHLAPEGFGAARNKLLRQRMALFAGKRTAQSCFLLPHPIRKLLK
jgi:hypothetical protein